MESGTEHVKVLQSVTLLLTTDCIVRGETLARVIEKCATSPIQGLYTRLLSLFSKQKKWLGEITHSVKH